MSEDLSEAEIKHLLADCRRRYALACLFRCATPISLPSVADHVTECEFEAPAETLLEKRLHVYMSLYHDHVPLLIDAKIVEYDQEGDMIDLAENATALEPYVARELARESEDT